MAMRRDISFAARYGPWALVAGASEGIGAAFAEAIAQRGVNVALVARRGPPLEALADRLTADHHVETLRIAADLANGIDAIPAALGDREVGIVVANAALSLLGPFLSEPLAAHLQEIDINCRAPLALAHEFGHHMVLRRRGGIILMSSLAGFQGGPNIANYAATRAYTAILAEGLWAELRHHGVDVLACCAGATTTPGLSSSNYWSSRRFAPRAQHPREVAEEALVALGTRPSHVTGRGNRLATLVMRRLIPRQLTIQLMEAATEGLSRSPKS